MAEQKLWVSRSWSESLFMVPGSALWDAAQIWYFRLLYFSRAIAYYRVFVETGNCFIPFSVAQWQSQDFTMQTGCLITYCMVRMLADFLCQSVSFRYNCNHTYYLGLPRWLSWQRIRPQCGRPGFNSWVWKIPWRRKWQSTLEHWPGESHGLVAKN